MAKGEGEQRVIRSHFVERVVQLPMVHVAWDYASSTYTNLKGSSRIANFTLTNAEKSVSMIAVQAKPVVLKFEKQIQAVDDLACKGLGTLEEKVPFIKKPAEEIIGDTRKLYSTTLSSRLEDIRKYGNETVRFATDFGIRQATTIFGDRLVQSVLTSVDGALVVTQNYVDRILPPSEDEKKNNAKKDDNEERSGLSRLAHISSTIHRRTYRILSLRIEQIQESGMEILVVYPLRSIELSKEYLNAAVEYANKLWIAIRQEESQESDNSEKSVVEQQLLHLARLVTKQIAAAYSTLGFLTQSTDSSQEPNQAPAAVVVVRERVLWIMGMVKLVPQLLPMYIYGFVSWLEQRRVENVKDKDDAKAANGVVKQNGVSSNHFEMNNLSPENNHHGD